MSLQLRAMTEQQSVTNDIVITSWTKQWVTKNVKLNTLKRGTHYRKNLFFKLYKLGSRAIDLYIISLSKNADNIDNVIQKHIYCLNV